MNSPVNVKVFPPSKVLTPQVHSIQVMDAPAGSLPGWEKVVPYGFGGLIFHFGDPYFIKSGENDKIQTLPMAFAVGLTTRPLWIKSSGVTGTITVNLHPAALWKMFSLDMKECINSIIDLNDFYDERLGECLSGLKKARTASDKACLIENFLVKTAKLDKPEKDIVDLAIEVINKNEGIINVHKLAGDLNISVSKLERHFRRKIGMTPKVYAGIYRFNKVFRFMKEHPGIDIHDVLYLCGYYDQPHFIRDFTRYAGETPGSFFTKVNEAVNVYSGKKTGSI